MKARAFFSQLGGKLGVGLCLAGFLFLFLGWNGAASVDRVSGQFPYLISGGLVGLSLVVIGVGMIVVQNQRADRAALQASIKALQGAVEAASGQLSDDAIAEFSMPPARPTPQHVVETIAAGGSGATDSASRQQPIEVLSDEEIDETGVIAPIADDAATRRSTSRKARRRGPLSADEH